VGLPLVGALGLMGCLPSSESPPDRVAANIKTPPGPRTPNVPRPAAQRLRPTQCADLGPTCIGDDCEPQILVSEPGREIEAVVMDTHHVYYTVCHVDYFDFSLYQCDLKRVNKVGGGVQALATGEGAISGGLAVDANNVYFTGQCGWGTGCKARRYSKATGVTSTLAEIGDPVSMNTDVAYLFWGGYNVSDYMPTIQRVPVGGGAVETIVADDPDSNAVTNYPTGFIEVNSTDLFYASSKTKRVPKAGGTPITLFDSQPLDPGFIGSETSLALDGRYVYTEIDQFGTPEGGIWRTPLAGGTSEHIFDLPFAEGSPSTGMAADGRGNLVWTNDVF
jgi:hypothetical protein